MGLNKKVLQEIQSRIESDFSCIISSVQYVKTGGFKHVYKAEVNGKIEALKIFEIPDLSQHPDSEEVRKEIVGRALREINILNDCSSPEIVKLGSITTTDYEIGANRYIVYSEEFLEGKDLDNIIKEENITPGEDELKILFLSLVKAIQEIWNLKQWVHRDIKPANVMKTKDTKRPFVLLDLGIAYSARGTRLTFNPLNRMPIGTHRYMAPERLIPSQMHNIDYRSDFYSAAVSVFMYASGKHPLRIGIKEQYEHTFYKTLNELPTPLKDLRTDLSDDFCELVDNMMNKRPALRLSNFSLIINRLEL